MKFKRLLCAVLAVMMVVPFIHLGSAEANALTMSYTPSSAYKKSSYYTALTQVSLTGNYATDLVNVALSQVGYHEGNSTSDLGGDNTSGSYNYTEYGYSWNKTYQPWCATFIGWCAEQANIPSSVIKKQGWATADDIGVDYYAKGSYTPKMGDIIIFDWTSDGLCTKTPASSYGDHVGIVYKVDSSTVYTVEGNTNNNKVEKKSYSLTNANIKGYGVYSSPVVNNTYTFSYNANGGTCSASSFTVKYGQQFKVLNTTCTREGYTWNGWTVKRNSDNRWYVDGVGWRAQSTIDEKGYEKKVYPNDKTLTFDDSWINGTTGDVSYTFYAVWEQDRDIRIKYWFSDSQMGNTITGLDTGKRLYWCYKMYDTYTGDFLDSFLDVDYSVKEIIYDPNGNAIRTETYANDNHWVSMVINTPGEYKGVIELTMSGQTVIYTNTIAVTCSHTYTYSITKSPTTSTTGTLTGTCNACSGTTTVTLPKLNTTDYTYKVTKAATCTATGTGRYTLKTTTYGSFYFDVTIAATGHSYSNKVVAPTCIAQGYTTHTCSCGYSYKDSYTNASGHSYTNGSCTRCGEKDPNVQSPEDHDVVFTLGDVSGKQGDTVRVELSVASAVDINSIAVHSIKYNSDILTFKGFENNETIAEKAVLSSFDEKTGTITIGLNPAEKYSGKICDLVFIIKETAQDGVNAEVFAQSIVKLNSTNITTYVESGKVTIQPQLLGDIDCNETVDINDALLLFQHSMLPTVYPIEYVGNIDFTQDGTVDINDALRLFQYSMLPDIYPIA